MNWDAFEPEETFEQIIAIAQYLSEGVKRNLERVAQDPAGTFAGKVRRFAETLTSLLGSLVNWLGLSIKSWFGFK